MERGARRRVLLPPEPEPEKLVVRATHVEAPALSAQELAAADELAEEPEEEGRGASPAPGGWAPIN